jgi:hypothetical protein
MYSLGIVWHDDGVYGGVESFSCNVKNEGYGNQPVDGLLLFLACHEAWRCVALRCVGFCVGCKMLESKLLLLFCLCPFECR